MEQQCENPKCDWIEYKRVILDTDKALDAKMKEFNSMQAKILEKQITILVEIGKLQVKSGLWGALAGIVTTVGVLLIFVFRGGF